MPEVFDFGPDGDDFYIAMELRRGPSLEEQLRDGALPLRRSGRPRAVALRVPREAHAFSATVEQVPIACCTTT